MANPHPILVYLLMIPFTILQPLFPLVVTKRVLFSGDIKSESLFDQWRYEVECLQTDGYSENVICLAIRRSLRGPAGRVLMRLGPNATVDEIMYKLDSIYGTVEEKETLMVNFYRAKQQESEEISA